MKLQQALAPLLLTPAFASAAGSGLSSTSPGVSTLGNSAGASGSPSSNAAQPIPSSSNDNAGATSSPSSDSTGANGPEGTRRKYCAENTICVVVTNGIPERSDGVLRVLDGGTIAVRIIYKSGDKLPQVSFTDSSTADSPFEKTPPLAAKAETASAKSKSSASEQWIASDPFVHTAAPGSTFVIVTVGSGAEELRFSVAVDRGRYYLEAGLFVGLVFDGRRDVVRLSRPDGSGQVYSMQTDTLVTTGFSVAAFPFGGRRKGNVFYWRGAASLRERLGELIGIQGVVAFSASDPFQRVQLGLVIEPIAGVSLNGGLAMVRTRAFAAGFSDGMSVVNEASEPSREVYRVRPYVGVTLTLDVLQSLSAAFSAISSQKVN